MARSVPLSMKGLPEAAEVFQQAEGKNVADPSRHGKNQTSGRYDSPPRSITPVCWLFTSVPRGTLPTFLPENRSTACVSPQSGRVHGSPAARYRVPPGIVA